MKRNQTKQNKNMHTKSRFFPFLPCLTLADVMCDVLRLCFLQCSPFKLLFIVAQWKQIRKKGSKGNVCAAYLGREQKRHAANFYVIQQIISINVFNLICFSISHFCRGRKMEKHLMCLTIFLILFHHLFIHETSSG